MKIINTTLYYAEQPETQELGIPTYEIDTNINNAINQINDLTHFLSQQVADYNFELNDNGDIVYKFDGITPTQPSPLYRTKTEALALQKAYLIQTWYLTTCDGNTLDNSTSFSGGEVSLSSSHSGLDAINEMVYGHLEIARVYNRTKTTQTSYCPTQTNTPEEIIPCGKYPTLCETDARYVKSGEYNPGQNGYVLAIQDGKVVPTSTNVNGNFTNTDTGWTFTNATQTFIHNDIGSSNIDTYTKEEIDNKDAATLQSSKDYVDSETYDKDDINQKLYDAVEESKAYTDQEIANITPQTPLTYSISVYWDENIESFVISLIDSNGLIVDGFMPIFTYCYSKDQVDTEIEQAFSAVSGDVALVKNKTSPQNWPANTEVNFGDGTYGYRYVGTLASGNPSMNTIMTDNSITGIISSGGYWKDNSSSGNMISVGHSYGNNWWSVIQFTAQAQLQLIISEPFGNSNRPCDVWVIYHRG